MKPELVIIGTPLSEKGPLPEEALKVIAGAKLIVGESRKLTDRYLKGVSLDDKEVFFLDGIAPRDEAALNKSVRSAASQKSRVVLFSDCGMPILFDPGHSLLRLARSLGFDIACLPMATSWATAMAVSGFSPPFLVLGFPPRENAARKEALRSLAKHQSCLVLMDAPYRFRALLTDCRDALGSEREAFLAWEISRVGENYLWGSLKELCERLSELPEKGEFVLVIDCPQSKR